MQIDRGNFTLQRGSEIQKFEQYAVRAFHLVT